MKKEIIVNRSLEETKVAVLEDGKLFDLFIERRESEKILNNIYKGKVQNIVPALNSAFVDLGFGKSAYLGIDDIVAQKNERNIENMIQPGQDVMVQVYKEPISTKGPKITMDISLPGRLLVYMPFSNNIGVSKNIEDREEYDRLKGIISEIKKEVPGGIIVRTEAEDATEEEIKREIKYLTRIWASIVSRFDNAKPMSLIHKDLGVVFQTVRDYFTEDVILMHIDSPKELRDVTEFVKITTPEFLDRIVLYEGKQSIFKAYGIDEEIKRLRSNRARLKSGGYLIIQEAESLCAIDVNSGKFTSKTSQEDTAAYTNIEAAEEVARQLRLRNIGGIIVIDFIDMRKASNRQKVLEKLREVTRGDKAKIKIWPITRLGLIEMTRERKRESLFSLMGDVCPVCRGLGLVLSKESIFINVCDDVEQMGIDMHHGKVKIKLNPDVVEYFNERKSRLKELFKMDFDIQSVADIDREDYQIIFE
ncbi:Rne/Rng family ribonuclease [Endomicrobium proavitum]|uniref:Ribonuclease G n=1 Tax=Endomicrobium proavitum TaxID=1408281 RepID=A0A0G3WLD2_9BACT|nr:Rne/Rng family ribonuclease [Endomicrobium proavitum]AKL98705.1 Ribonuclease G [Endomicrobium proavitum]